MMGIKMPETCRDSSQQSTSGIDNKSFIFLHLVGILSSRSEMRVLIGLSCDLRTQTTIAIDTAQFIAK